MVVHYKYFWAADITKMMNRDTTGKTLTGRCASPSIHSTISVKITLSAQ